MMKKEVFWMSRRWNVSFHKRPENTYRPIHSKKVVQKLTQPFYVIAIHAISTHKR